MNTKIHSIHFDADQKLISFINEKMDKLVQFNADILSSEVYLRLEKSSTSENKLVEIRLNVPGHEFFAKRHCRTFEEAIEETAEALRQQIKKHKYKH